MVHWLSNYWSVWQNPVSKQSISIEFINATDLCKYRKRQKCSSNKVEMQLQFKIFSCPVEWQETYVFYYVIIEVIYWSGHIGSADTKSMYSGWIIYIFFQSSYLQMASNRWHCTLNKNIVTSSVFQMPFSSPQKKHSLEISYQFISWISRIIIHR